MKLFFNLSFAVFVPYKRDTTISPREFLRSILRPILLPIFFERKMEDVFYSFFLKQECTHSDSHVHVPIPMHSLSRVTRIQAMSYSNFKNIPIWNRNVCMGIGRCHRKMEDFVGCVWPFIPTHKKFKRIQGICWLFFEIGRKRQAMSNSKFIRA